MPYKYHTDKPVIDAEIDLVVKVTSKDRNRGTTSSATSCAIAQSIMRTHKVDGVRIFRSVAYVETDDQVFRYSLGAEAVREIQAFDATSYFRPGTYTLKAPSGKARLGGQPKGRTRGPDKPSYVRSHVADFRRLRGEV